MLTALTPGVARDLGRTLRFLRHGRDLTLADVAKRSGVSIGYVQNIESGVRHNADDGTYAKLGHGLGLDREVIDDLLLRARIMSALDHRGIAPDIATFVWRGVEQRLEESGARLQLNLERVIADMLPR